MKLLNKVLSHFQNQLPFVAYIKPNETILNGVFQNDAILHVFDNEPGFLFASFHNEKNIVFPFSYSLLCEEEINFDIIENKIHFETQSDENTQITFENLVRKGVSEIENGTFQKVVLSRKIEVSQSIDILKSFKNLLKKYPTAFRYLWFHPKVGMWMGATPEQLAKIENHKFETVALAGTQVFAENVSWQEKEIVEQQLVTNYIKSKVESLVEHLLISDAYTHKAGNLVHLKSNISGELKQNISEINLLKTLHPTSAVCGMPLEQARSFILENEKYNRKYYAGFLGEFQMHKQTNLFVNLRCCEIENDVTTIYVGCGITKDSKADKEFIETENKAKTIKNILVIA